MKRFIAIFAILLVTLFALSGCGGGGDTDPDQAIKDIIDSGTTDPGTTDPGTTDPGTTDPVSVAAIILTPSSSAIGTEETVELTVTLFDSSGQLVTASKLLTFTLDAPALGSVPSPVTVSNGFTKQTFTARNIEGSVTITATAEGKSDTKTIQISDLVSADRVEVSANPTTLTVGGTAVVSATVYDTSNSLMPDGTTVNFSVDNPALGTIVSSASTSNGIAQATFEAGSTIAGTATVTATSGGASGTTPIVVNAPTVGGIAFGTATPQVVSIQGAGGQETSVITFQVNDANGDPIIGSQTVRLTLTGPNGGEYLGSTPGTTTLEVGTVNGIATVILHSGTIPGTATITGTVLDNNGVPTDHSTSSGVIAIGGGTPSAGHFSLSAEVLNLEGGAFDNITDDILTLLADRYGNRNVLQGTTVSFYSECGAIERAVPLDNIGQGTVVFRTQSPDPQDVLPDSFGTPWGSGSCGDRCDQENAFITSYNTIFGVDITQNASGNNPRDGLCSIIAVVDGEEEFTDADASGTYDLGEAFADTYDDIHIDMDDDPIDVADPVAGYPHDATFEDLVVDRNEDGFFDGLNGVWDQNKRISKKIDLLYTGEPGLKLSTFNLNVPHGGSQTIYFALHDANFNRPIGGTQISVSASGSGTLSGTKTFTYLDSNALGTPIFSVTVSDSDPETDEKNPVELTFSWSWKGNVATLTIAGFTN